MRQHRLESRTIRPVREAAFNIWEQGGVRRRPPLFVPKITKISEVLRTLQRQRQDIALVVDEYGNVAGLIAIRDIVEGHLQAYGHEYVVTTSCPLFFSSLFGSLLATRAVSEVVRSLALVSGRIIALYARCAPASGRLGAAVASGARSALIASVMTTLTYVSTRGGD